MEILFGIIGTLGAVVLLLFKRASSLKRKVSVEQQKARTAQRAATHNAKITETLVERNSAQGRVIEEKADEAINNDFSDFYNDSDK